MSYYLLECLNNWTMAYDHPNAGLDKVYTDFRKAVDSLPHRKQLLKLEGYDIQGKILGWIKAFLTQRKQGVILNSSYSRWAYVVSSVPQGTLLGPVFSSLFRNDLPPCVKNDIKLIADDCKAYKPMYSVNWCFSFCSDFSDFPNLLDKTRFFFIQTIQIIKTFQT